MDSLSVHAFIRDLLVTVKLFKRCSGQRLDHIHGIFDIIHFPQSEMPLRECLEKIGNKTQKIVIPVSIYFKALTQRLDLQATLSENITRESSDIDQN